MPLGMEISLGPGDFVLDGDPAPPKRSTAANFRPVSIVAKRSPISATAEILLMYLWRVVVARHRSLHSLTAIISVLATIFRVKVG